MNEGATPLSFSIRLHYATVTTSRNRDRAVTNEALNKPAGNSKIALNIALQRSATHLLAELLTTAHPYCISHVSAETHQRYSRPLRIVRGL